MKLSYKELMVFLQRWMIVSDARMPQSIYQSLYEIEKNFGDVSKICMLGDIEGELCYYNNIPNKVDIWINKEHMDKSEIFDSVADLIDILKKNNIEVTDVPE